MKKYYTIIRKENLKNLNDFIPIDHSDDDYGGALVSIPEQGFQDYEMDNFLFIHKWDIHHKDKDIIEFLLDKNVDCWHNIFELTEEEFLYLKLIS